MSRLDFLKGEATLGNKWVYLYDRLSCSVRTVAVPFGHTPPSTVPRRHAPQCRRQLRLSAVRAQCALDGVPQYTAKAVPLVACLSQIPDYPLDPVL